MSLSPRQARERAFFNEHTQVDEYATWKEFPFETWRTYRPIERTATDFLGDVIGKRLLIAGVGVQAILFARAGAEVWGFDIAEQQVEAVRAAVERHGLTARIHLGAMAFESLEYETGFFDMAFGEAILHHIDLRRGGAELARVLRPGARASFIEPLGTNPVLEFARRHLPYPSKSRTEEERPLTYRDIREFATSFAASRYREFGLLSMLNGRIVTHRPTMRRLESADEWILARAAWLRRLGSMIWVGVETHRSSDSESRTGKESSS